MSRVSLIHEAGPKVKSSAASVFTHRRHASVDDSKRRDRNDATAATDAAPKANVAAAVDTAAGPVMSPDRRFALR